MDIIQTVKISYDKIAAEYYQFRDLKKMNPELEKFSELLTNKGRVLDAGTGAGMPVARFLVNKGLQVTGIDISESMIVAAKKNVPEAEFFQLNILDLNFSENTFDGIICVYTLWHIPRSKHREIFSNFKRMLKHNGILMINTGIRESDNMSLFFGQPMLWSNNNPKETLDQILKLGFEIIFEGILERGGEHQYWIYARCKK
ncbi:MAG: class I SAM-dependent methyltransferase [Candidatus Thorarchaeota archaeon]